MQTVRPLDIAAMRATAEDIFMESSDSFVNRLARREGGFGPAFSPFLKDRSAVLATAAMLIYDAGMPREGLRYGAMAVANLAMFRHAAHTGQSLPLQVWLYCNVHQPPKRGT